MTALKTSDSAVEFLIRFVRVGHEAGYPTADLEDRILALARSLGRGRRLVVLSRLTA